MKKQTILLTLLLGLFVLHGTGMAVGFSLDKELVTGSGLQDFTFTPDGEYLYISHWGGNNPDSQGGYSIIRTSDNTLVDTISGLVPGNGNVGKISFTPDGQYAYLPNYMDSNSVLVVRTSDHTVVETIGGFGQPIKTSMHPNGQYVYVSNYGSGIVSVIRVSDNQVVDTINVGNRPVSFAFPDNRYLYVSNYPPSSYEGYISVIDTIDPEDNVIVTTVNLPIQPYAIAANPNGNYIYLGDLYGMEVATLDVSTNEIIASTPIGGMPWYVDVDPEGEYIYASGSEQNFSVINAADNSLIGNFTRGVEMGAIAIGRNTNDLYVVDRTTASSQKVLVLNETQWESVTPIPEATSNHFAHNVNGIIYAGQGATPGGTDQGRLYSYDPASDTWTKKTKLSDVYQVGSGVYGDRIYTFGGVEHGGPLNYSNYYDTTTDTWTSVASIPTQRVSSASVTFDNKIYILGGDHIFGDAGDASPANEMYDPVNNTWTVLEPMPRPRMMHSAEAVNGKIYVFGGAPKVGQPPIDVVDVYDISTNTWSTLVTPMPKPSSTFASVVYNGRIILMGGGDSQGIFNLVQMYNPSANTWSFLDNMLSPRAAHSATIVGNYLYVIGGEYGPYLSSVERLDLSKLSIFMTSTPCPTIYELGDEFQINTYTNGEQASGQVAVLSNGDFVVVWGSANQDGSAAGIFGKVFDSNGVAQNTEFPINEYTTNTQYGPALSSFDSGGFVAVWASDGQDGSNMGVFGRVFNNSGNETASEFQVNTNTNNHQTVPAVAAFSDGRFVVVWQSWHGTYYDIYGQLFNKDGSKIGTEFKINTGGSYHHQDAEVAVLSDDSFVVAWQSENQDGDGLGVFAQRFDTNGNQLDTEFQANTYTTSDQHHASVISLANGWFAISWTSNTQDGNGEGVYCQIYDSGGNKVGNEFRVNDTTLSDQRNPHMALISDSEFIVSWDSYGPEGDDLDVYWKTFDFYGNSTGNEIIVNSYTGGQQSNGRITMLKNQALAIVWNSENQDGSYFGVFGKLASPSTLECVEKIVFHSDRSGNSDIWMMNPDGSNPVQLTTDTAGDYGPAISPDGTKISFHSNRNGNYDIFVLDLITGSITQLTSFDSNDAGSTWSPDSTEVAFQSYEGGYGAIWKVPANGGTPSRVTFPSQPTPTEGDLYPHWNPETGKIVFMSTQGHQDLWSIWEVASDGSGTESEIIERFGGNEMWPAYSSDGKQVVWSHLNAASCSSSGANIWTAATDGTDRQEIYSSSNCIVGAKWSPDMSRFVFRLEESDIQDIWVVNNDGTGLSQLTNDGSNNSAADWRWVVVDSNSPPVIPSNPSPSDAASAIAIDTITLTWTGGDPDVGDTITYDVYWGTDSGQLSVVSSDQSDLSYQPSTLSYGTTYYWQIVAEDSNGATTQGPVWSFTTCSDCDADGMLDSWEIAKFGDTTSCDGSGDADRDGLTDLEEYNHGTDPLDPDTDKDGLSDGYEVNTNGSDPNVAEGLVAYYPFNGNANDASGNGNDGAVNGPTVTSDRLGNANSAYYFDGVNDDITVSHNDAFNLNGSNALTLSAWIKAEELINHAGVWHKGTSPSNYNLWVYSNGDAHESINDSSGSAESFKTNSPMSANEWYHLAVVHNGMSVVIYINGQHDSSGAYTNAPIPNTSAFYIGNDVNGSAEYFKGIIDDVRVYNRAFSEVEIQELYNQEVPSLLAKTFGGSGVDYIYDSALTKDGGYILAGYTTSFGAGSSDFWVLKFNKSGSVEWQKTIGGNNADIALAIQQTSDGGYIIGGHTASFGSGGQEDAWIIKLNPNGTIAWQKAYGGAGFEKINSIQETSDGGYISVGSSSSFGGGDTFWILKLNSDGSIAWQKTYDGPYDEYPMTVKEILGNGYIVAGIIQGTPTERRAWLLKLNGDGSIAWQKEYDGNGAEALKDISITADGGYIAAGYTGSYGTGDICSLILKLNADGTVVWQKVFDGANTTDLIQSIIQLSDGSYVALGETNSFGNGSYDVWLLKLNSDGNLIWQKTYGGSSSDDSGYTSILQTFDGGFIAPALTYSFGAGGADLLLLKLNSNGEIPGCDLMGVSSATVITPGYAPQDTTVSPFDTSIVPVDSTATAQDTAAIESTICSVMQEVPPNSGPNLPTTPSPPDTSTGIDLDTGVTWTGGDPDAGDTVTYDVYFGTDSGQLSVVSSDQSGLSYQPSALSYGTTYYWQIVARDNHGAETTGPVWSFTTCSDCDADGMLDSWEISEFGDTTSRDGSGDADRDGLTDLEEYNHGTDPLDPDTDKDGLSDGYEVNTNGSDPNVAEGRVAYYPFNGTADDASGNGNNGSEFGAMGYIQGVNGQAVSFDGTTGYLELYENTNLDGFAALTISLWIKPANQLDSQTGRQEILFKGTTGSGDSYALNYDDWDGQLAFPLHSQSAYHNEGIITHMAQFDAEEWFHVAITYDGVSEVSMYVDGIQVGNDFRGLMDGTISDRSEPLTVGRRPDGNYYFNGAVDELQIYDRMLSIGEIQEISSSINPVTVLSTFPSRTITIDGQPDDWNGIQAYYTDPQGDSTCETGTDIAAIYLAKDFDYVYWRMDTHSGTYSSGTVDVEKFPKMFFYQQPGNPWPNGVGAHVVLNENYSSVSIRTDGTNWIYQPSHSVVGTGANGQIAEGRVPLSLVDPFSIDNLLAIYMEFPGTVCDDASYTYTLNNAPYIPVLPSPENTAADSPVNSTLSWTSGDPDAVDTVRYDVYLGTDSGQLSVVSNDQLDLIYQPSTLSYGVTYYWQIVVKDNNGATTQGPVWSFTTCSDCDADGLPDSWEIALFGNVTSSDGTGDTDGDGLNDLEEYNAGTDPKDPDSDNDGLSDRYEINVNNSDPSVAEGLVAYYPFNGNVNDESGNGNNGTISGATPTIDRHGNQSSAYQFDGINDHIRIEDHSSLDLTGTLTLSAWIKTNSAGTVIRKEGDGETAATDENYRIHVKDTGRVVAGFEDGSGTDVNVLSGGTIVKGAWQHVAWTYDGVYIRIYINGILDRSVPETALPNTQDEPLYIGVRNRGGTTTDWFSGRIDDVRIYNRALSGNEINELARGEYASVFEDSLAITPDTYLLFLQGEGFSNQTDGNQNSSPNGDGSHHYFLQNSAPDTHLALQMAPQNLFFDPNVDFEVELPFSNFTYTLEGGAPHDKASIQHQIDWGNNQTVRIQYDGEEFFSWYNLGAGNQWRAERYPASTNSGVMVCKKQGNILTLYVEGVNEDTPWIYQVSDFGDQIRVTTSIGVSATTSTTSVAVDYSVLEYKIMTYPPPVNTIFHDNFDDNDIGDWTVGDLYQTEQYSTPFTDSGAYIGGEGSNQGGHYQELDATAAFPVFTVEFDARSRNIVGTSGSHLGIHVDDTYHTNLDRSGQSANGYIFGISAAQGVASVSRQENGTNTPLARTLSYPNDSGFHRVRFDHLSDGTWRIFVDGVAQQLEYNNADTTFSSFRFVSMGVDPNGGTGINAIDNVRFYADADGSFVSYIPAANIAIDGDSADWAGIAPVISDPQGDSLGSSFDDILDVYLAKNNDYLFVRYDFGASPPDPNNWYQLNLIYTEGSFWHGSFYSGGFGILHDVSFYYDSGQGQWAITLRQDTDLVGGIDQTIYQSVDDLVLSGNTFEGKIPLYQLSVPFTEDDPFMVHANTYDTNLTVEEDDSQKILLNTPYAESDTTNPTPPIGLQATPSPSVWSNDNTITVSWTAGIDAGTGVAGYSFLWDTSPDTVPDNAADTSNTTTTSAALQDGKTHYFHVRTVDNAGNASTTEHIGPFYIDTTQPQNGSVSINGGAEGTGVIDVTLTLSATDVGSDLGQMRFSNDNTNWSAPVPYATSADWQLASGQGLKTVYVQFSDAVDNWTSASVSDQINLTTSPPDVTGLTVEAGNGEVTLSWDQITSPTGITYKIYRSELENGIYYQVNTQDIDNFYAYLGRVSYADTNVANGKTYYYRVKSFLNETPSDNYSNLGVSTPVSAHNFTVTIDERALITEVGGKSYYDLRLLPTDRFQGTITLSCSSLPQGLSYDFILNGESKGSYLAGIVPPAIVRLEITAGSTTPPEEHTFKVVAQNFWPGGSSNPLEQDLMLAVAPLNGSGVFVTVEKTEVLMSEAVTISGRIYPPLPDKSVILRMTFEDSSSQEKTLTTIEGGKFEETDWISTLGIGFYNIEASWTDPNSNLITSDSKSFWVDKGRAILTCLRNTDETPSAGSDFTIHGGTEPEIPYAEIKIRVFDPDGGWQDYTSYAGQTGTYSKIYSFFDRSGIWKVKAYWEGNAQYIGCESDLLVIPVEVDYGRAIIVGGGVAEQTNTYWDVTKKLTTQTYRDFKTKGFNDGMIYFMINSQTIDINYDDIPDPVVDDDIPSTDDFISAVSTYFSSELAANTPLFIYMQGHGTSDGKFQILGSDQRLGAGEIANALDQIQTATGCKIILILESCYSGNFIPSLSGANRVILTSAGNEKYYTDASARISFSRYLMTRLRGGDNVKKAFDWARKELMSKGYPSPLLDDNGDQVVDTSDGLLAANTYLNGLLTWGLPPEITDISLAAFLEGSTSTPISVTVVQGDVSVDRVWAQIIPPDADITGGDTTITYPEVDLAFNSGTGKYEGTLAGLAQSGLYTILVQAEDVDHEVAEPSTAYISVSGTAIPGDLNSDGLVDLKDAVIAVQAMVGIDVSGLVPAGYATSGVDVNGDGQIGVAEAVYILQEISGLRD